MVPDILKDEYRFSQSGVYFSPPESNMAKVNQYFETLPLTVCNYFIYLFILLLFFEYFETLLLAVVIAFFF